MRRTLLILVASTSPLLAQEQQSADLRSGVATAKSVWLMAHDYVIRSAEQVPESLYSFKPTPEVRSLGALFAHVADGERLLCTMSKGEQPKMDPKLAVEGNKTTKADILQALRDAASYCESAYAQSDAAVLNAPVNFFGRPVTRMWTLNFNGAHTFEHYGNIVTYMRMKGMTPPSSQR